MAPIAKRPRQSDDYDSAPPPPVTSAGTSGVYYDNVPGTSMTRPLGGQPASGPSFSSHAAYPGATSTASAAANGVNGAVAHHSSGVDDDEDMAPPKSPSTAQGARGRGRGRGSRGGARARGRGRATTTAAAAGPSSSRAKPNGHTYDDDAESDGTPPNPLTFQCRTCFRLLGDSLAFVATDPDLGYVILSDVSEIVVQDSSYETSTEPGKDIGSTFARLRCAGCNATVGRNYRTTPRDLDDLRDCFSLEVDAVYTYQLGSNYTRQIEELEQQGGTGVKAERASIQMNGAKAGRGGEEDTQALVNKMERTRALTIELSDRLIKAEEEIRRYSALVDELVQSKSGEEGEGASQLREEEQKQQQQAREESLPAEATAFVEIPGTPPLDAAEQRRSQPSQAEAEAEAEAGASAEVEAESAAQADAETAAADAQAQAEAEDEAAASQTGEAPAHSIKADSSQSSSRKVSVPSKTYGSLTRSTRTTRRG